MIMNKKVYMAPQSEHIIIGFQGRILQSSETEQFGGVSDPNGDLLDFEWTSLF